MPLVPEVPLDPDVPSIPEVPEVPEVPDVPSVPDVPDVPSVPEVPDVPSVPEVPLFPEVPDVPDVPEVPLLPAGPISVIPIVCQAYPSHFQDSPESSVYIWPTDGDVGKLIGMSYLKYFMFTPVLILALSPADLMQIHHSSGVLSILYPSEKALSAICIFS